MAAALPARVRLPSGRLVLLDDADARAAAAGSDPGGGIHRRELAILCASGVVRSPEGTPVDVLGMKVADVHVLRAFLFHAGVLDEPEEDYTCSNCRRPFRASPSALWETGPFRDDELDDAELDAPFPFEREHAVPPLPLAVEDDLGGRRRTARTVRLAERTVGAALPLWRAVDRDELRLTPAVVTALGVTALGGERRAKVVARSLREAPDRAWGAVVDLWHAATYVPRLGAVHRCTECGARNDLDVPLSRELPRPPEDHVAPSPARSRRRARGFPDLDAFEVKVRAAAERVYSERGVRNVDLFIDDDVPLCDDGGEPLLGCYTPGGPGGDSEPARAPEVRIFYRTFRDCFLHEPGFDVDAEIEETLDHEITHHLHFLSGHDPLDDEEHAEIERERAGLIGRREGTRRAARGALADLAGFARATWPVWLVVAAGTALAWCAG